MSRHSLDEILVNEQELIDLYDLENGESEVEEPTCLKGYPLFAWLRECIVGWDEGLETYFIQSFEVCIDGCDELVWWLGVTPREIPSFDMLCTVINSLFDNKVNFKFINNIEKS